MMHSGSRPAITVSCAFFPSALFHQNTPNICRVSKVQSFLLKTHHQVIKR